ncbi:hypothetical protein D3C76_1620140 [compost metagenome]
MLREHFAAPVEQPLSILRVAHHMLEIAQSQRLAQRTAINPQVGNVDQAQLMFWREHDVAQMRRAEIDPALMQGGHESPQLAAQRISVAFVVQQLAQGLTR